MRITQLLASRALAVGTALVVAAGTANAQPVGTLNVAGALRFFASGGNLFIDILPSNGGEGQVFADPFSQSGDFTAAAGANGTMLDFEPNVGENNVPGLLTIAGFTFDLNEVGAGAFSSAQCDAPVAAGQTCSPAGTAFNLVNLTTNQSSASFRVRGRVREGDGPAIAYRGVFTAQFNTNFQNVIEDATSNGGIATSFSASLTTVPEPATVTLMGAGLLALAGVAARRRRATA